MPEAVQKNIIETEDEAEKRKEALSKTAAASELKRKSVRGGAATVLARGTGLTLQIVTTLVLARLLSPADYGLQAMVLTLINLCSLLQYGGLNFAAVQRETLTHEQLSTLFWINLALGAFLTLLVAGASPLLVVFYKDPRLFWVTVFSATVFLFNSLGAQHRALLERAIQFTTISKIDILSSVVGALIAIGMAFGGCGYWSLICQNISMPIIATVGVWIVMPWLPGRPRWMPELGSMLRFGGTITLNTIVVYFAYNTEKILLGHFWGPAALGLYGRAYQLSNLPVQQVSDSFGAVVFPMLSRLQGDPDCQRRSYLKSHSLIVAVTVPAVICCALFADEIVRIMLGPKWSGAALVLRLLSPAILAFALMNPFAWLLMATGRVARSLNIALLIAPVVIAGVVAGIHHGPPGVALGYSIAMVVLLGPTVAWSKQGTGITTRDYWNCVKGPIIAGSLAACAVWFFKLSFFKTATPIPPFAMELAIFFAIYALFLLFAMGQKDVYVDLLSHLFQRVGSNQ